MKKTRPFFLFLTLIVCLIGVSTSAMAHGDDDGDDDGRRGGRGKCAKTRLA